jgi:hypothetical protein
MIMRSPVLLLVSMFVAGCGTPSLDKPPVTASDVALEPTIDRASTIRDTSSGVAPTDPSRVLVLQTTKLERFAEVLGPVDVHEPMGSDQAALQRLREKAAALGADAVVGVEFHHGEAEGEPTHLSGLAVRFVGPVSFPMN